MRILPKKAFLTKRRKFILVSLVLSVGLLLIQRLTVEQRYVAIGLLAVMSYSFTAWALLAEMRGIIPWVNMVLPVMYPTAVALFYFLLPQAAITRMIVGIFFAISMYGLLLTTNIYAVASIRTIQLLRAGRAVGFLLSILTSALLYHVIFSFRLGAGITTLAVMGVSYPLFLHGVWSYSLGERLRGEGWYALVGALVMAEIAWAITFWLIDIPLASVLLAMGMYVILGIFQHNVEGRLFARTLQEYLWFAGIVYMVVAGAVLMRWVS